MNRKPQLHFITACFTLCFLTACSSTQGTRPGSLDQAALYDSRYDLLLGLDEWSLEGRLAVNDGHDGGSGHLIWSRRGEASTMNFHGALGRGAWRLDVSADGAILELADGEVYRASSVNALLKQRLGWEVPIDALAWWVRGLAAPGEWEARELGEYGKLLILTQFGWVIEFGKYRDIDGVAMPQKMTARQESHTVKLAVRKWALGLDSGRNE